MRSNREKWPFLKGTKNYFANWFIFANCIFKVMKRWPWPCYHTKWNTYGDIRLKYSYKFETSLLKGNSILKYWFHKINIRILEYFLLIFCLIFLIGAIKHIVEKKFKLVLFLMWLFKGSELRAYKMKQVMFLCAVGLLAATKTLHKRKEKK